VISPGRKTSAHRAPRHPRIAARRGPRRIRCGGSRSARGARRCPPRRIEGDWQSARLTRHETRVAAPARRARRTSSTIPRAIRTDSRRPTRPLRARYGR
jgi:hypothetical protein